MVDPISRAMELQKDVNGENKTITMIKTVFKCLDHLFVWFGCQEDRGQSSSGLETHVQWPLCVVGEAKADRPQVLSWQPPDVEVYQVMETIEQETCGLVFSVMYLISLPVDHFHFHFQVHLNEAGVKGSCRPLNPSH